MSKMNLTEATMLALQGKLEESTVSVKRNTLKPKVNERKLKKENIDVNVDDKTNVSIMDKETIVDTDDATIIIDKKEDEFVPETSDGEILGTDTSIEAPVETPTDTTNMDDEEGVDVDTIEVPIEGDDTVVPDVDTDIDADDIDLPLDTDSANDEEVADNSEEEVDNSEEDEKDEEVKESKELDADKSKKIENSKRAFAKKKALRVKAECKRAKRENKLVGQEKEKLIKQKVENIQRKRIESKITFRYNAKSFNEALTKLYQRHTKTIESAEIVKLDVAGRNLIVEAKLTNKDGMTKTAKLEMKPSNTTGIFTKYNVTEYSKAKTEGKLNRLDATMLTRTNKSNVVECRYIVKK